MTAWAAGAWATGAWTGTAWQAAAAVTVPDVVGQTQADATTALQSAGFVVAVVTAASSTVPAGAVISQVPAGGAEATAGSTVTITVSTGEVDLTDAKFQGPSHNTRIRWERKRKEDAAAAEAAELAAPPAEPLAPPAPAPKPRSTGMGEIVLPPVEVAAPEIEIPEIKVVASPAPVAPAPAPASVETAAAPAPAEPTPPAVLASAEFKQAIEELTASVEGMVVGLAKQVAQLQKALEKQARAHAQHMETTLALLRAAEKRAINAERKAEIARRAANDLADD